MVPMGLSSVAPCWPGRASGTKGTGGWPGGHTVGKARGRGWVVLVLHSGIDGTLPRPEWSVHSHVPDLMSSVPTLAVSHPPRPCAHSLLGALCFALAFPLRVPFPHTHTPLWATARPLQVSAWLPCCLRGLISGGVETRSPPAPITH